MIDFSVKDLPVAAIFFDKNGVIEDMNVKAEIILGKSAKLSAGKNILEFFPDPEKKRIKEILEAPKTCSYIFEKNDFRKFVYVLPHYSSGIFRGFIQFIFDIPHEIQTFIRKA